MKPLPFRRSPSNVGGSEGFKSFLTVRVTTVGRAGVGVGVGAEVGCAVGRDEIMRVRADNVSPIMWRVLSILASLLAIRSSSSVSRESVVSGSGGS
jgi:hypothetical protein